MQARWINPENASGSLSYLVASFLKFSVHAKKDVSFATPVISQVSRGVLDHADSNASELLSAPVREPEFACVLGLLDLGPVCNTERNARHLH